MIARWFEFERRGTTWGRELRGGVATFLTMSYILFANAAILAAAMPGVPPAAIIAATALAAGVCCLLLGLTSNFPLALASGMGLNAAVAGLVLTKAVPDWHAAMGLVVVEGLVILVLVLCGLREAMLLAIPRDLRLAISAGIGLFIAFIGLVKARIVVVPDFTVKALAAHNSSEPPPVLPPVTYGSFHDHDVLIAVAGLVVIAVLMAWRVRGAILLGILAATAISWGFQLHERGLPRFEAPGDWGRLGDAAVDYARSALNFETVGKVELVGLLKWEYIPILLSLMMVDFFDTLGTLTGLAEQAELTEGGQIPHLRRVLVVDSLSASIGGFCGVSSVTSYIESAAGIAEGARTGLHSIFVGLFFLAAILAAPLIGAVPEAATAPALIIVGFLMAKHITGIDFTKLDTALPAFVTIVGIPLTYSIAHGVGFGVLTFVVLKLGRLRFWDVHILLYAAAALFAAYFALGKS